MTAKAILLVLAVVCFVLAALGVQARISWRDAGFAFVTASLLV